MRITNANGERIVDAPRRIHYRLVPQSLAAKIRNFLPAVRYTAGLSRPLVDGEPMDNRRAQ